MKKNVKEIDEDEFMRWFIHNYRPDPTQKGWYIDRVCKGAKATIDGARNQFVIIQEIMKSNPFDNTEMPPLNP